MKKYFNPDEEYWMSPKDKGEVMNRLQLLEKVHDMLQEDVWDDGDAGNDNDYRRMHANARKWMALRAQDIRFSRSK